MQSFQTLPTVIKSTYDKLEQYRILDQQIKLLTKEKDELSKELKSGFFKDNDEFIYNDRLIATCTTQISERMDTSRIKVELPEIYSLYQVETCSRVMRLK